MEETRTRFLRRDARIPEGQLKRCESFFVLAHSVGQEMRFGTMFKPNLLASETYFLVNKKNKQHGRQVSAENCRKHLLSIETSKATVLSDPVLGCITIFSANKYAFFSLTCLRVLFFLFTKK